MGESAMFLRSFSHPSHAYREAKEGDPICALTESISFGRFMSESLAWEKWSTFSHNRYLDEVEKFSKPGSVAEKKAYFEAHYKRKAAMKVAASEEANLATNEVPELNTTSEFHKDPPMDLESAKANSHVAVNEQKEQCILNTENDPSVDTELAKINSDVAIDEQWQKDCPGTEVADSADANAFGSINVRNDLEHTDLEKVVPVIEYAVNVENLTQADNSKQLENANVLDKIVATPVENMLNKEAVEQENSVSSIKKKRSTWSSKLSTQSGASGLTPYPSKQAPSLPPRNVNNISTTCKKSVGGSNEKKRFVPKSLHMSINFTSHASEATKGSLKMPKDCSTPIRTPIRASVNGVSKHLPKIFYSEDKSGSKSLRNNGSKAQSPNLSSPFSFRSEERAAKRKEFFQKLEEKSNAKEAEKVQVETKSKGKAEHDIKKLRQSTGYGAKQNEHLCSGSNLQSNHLKKGKAEYDTQKLRQSTGFKVKPNEDLYCGSPLPSNRMKKQLSLMNHALQIPLTQPWSAKLGGKPTPTAVQDTSSRPPRKPSSNAESTKHVIEKTNRNTTRSITSPPRLVKKPTPNTVQDANTRPPWRSSMSTASFKRVMEKSNRSTTLSVTSLPKKNAHENASPNIQR